MIIAKRRFLSLWVPSPNIHTLRERDSMKQERVKISELLSVLLPLVQ